MTNVFAVVGEHCTEPERLLLLGEDGRYYAYAPDGRLIGIEPNEAWRLDVGSGRPSGAESRPGDTGRVRAKDRHRSV